MAAALVLRRVASSPPCLATPPLLLTRQLLCRSLRGLAPDDPAAPLLDRGGFGRGHDLAASNTRIKELGRLGRIVEARRLFDGLPQRDAVTWNSMIAAYSHHGLAREAKALFDAFAERNARTWTILLSAYAREGRVREARRLFDSMPERNVVSWNAMISGHVQSGDIASARHLFEHMPERNVVSWNSMITGYCHAHLMAEARQLFEAMPEKNLVSWTVMISGYVQTQEFAAAWRVFRRMIRSGLRPDQSNVVAAITAVTGSGDLGLLESLRSLATKANLEGDVVVGSAILNMYTRYDARLNTALRFFEGMPQRNEYSWSTIISALSQIGRLEDAASVYARDPDKLVAARCAMLTGYAQNRRVEEARQIFDEIRAPSTVAWNAMIAGYAQNGMIEEAAELFDRVPERNAITWAAMISGCAQNGKNEEGLQLLAELHRRGMLPSCSCLTSSLFACGNLGALEMGRQVHSLAMKVGSHFNAYVGNALITMYAKCKDVRDVARVFSGMKVKDVVSWNSLIAGLSQNAMLEDARHAFDRMPRRDAVSWTAMISAYVQAGEAVAALRIFSDMVAQGFEPNASALSGLLSACAGLGAARLGRQIHCLAFRLGVESDTFVSNALIAMYFKCGSVEGFRVFEEMPRRDVVSWNSILAGCAQHGLAKEAVGALARMKAEGALPNETSFVAVLCACSHGGLVEEGRRHLDSMQREYGLMPNNGHYACMVDLLGRAGRLAEAEELIEAMPVEPDAVVYGALLGACRIHRAAELGQRVAERLFQIEPGNSGNYVLLSNIYASLGRWDEVAEVRKLMRDRGVPKEPACSWTQLGNRVQYFATGDRRHPQAEEMDALLRRFYGKLKAAGYVPETGCVLHDVEEEHKENALLGHSEKLALACALLNTPCGAPILIMKNLRICADCHAFVKWVSGETRREIRVRDGNRFHHFVDGACSCGDYW
ncbi:putative pentatricopeptide repeat-containing protein At3g13770, mitochondrial [Wolffia australiana]